MAWVAIASSGLPFELVTDDPSAYTLDGSVLSGTPSNFGGGISSDQVRRYRLTFQSYLSQGVSGGTNPSQILYYPDPEGEAISIANENTAFQATSFSPSPVEFEAAFWQYSSGFGPEAKRQDTFEALVEVWTGQSSQAVIVVQRTYQAIRRGPTLCECWVRNEEGSADLSGMSIEIQAVAYGGRHVRATWPATGDAAGRLQFTVPEDHVLNEGLHQLRARVEGTGQLVSLGLLEIV